MLQSFKLKKTHLPPELYVCMSPTTIITLQVIYGNWRWRRHREQSVRASRRRDVKPTHGPTYLRSSDSVSPAGARHSEHTWFVGLILGP